MAAARHIIVVGQGAAGLAAMERGGVRGSIIDGVSAAMRRAGELG